MSDWNDKVNSGSMVLDNTHVYEGSMSLKVSGIGSDHVIKILNMSESDLPASVTFDFYSYWEGTARVALFYRYQDLDNYYWCTISCEVVANDVGFRLNKRVAGVNTYGTLIHFGSWHMAHSWQHWKVEFCQIGSSIYALLYNNDVFRAIDTINGTIHWNNGACGVGSGIYGLVTQPYWLDYTKIYY